MGSVLGCADLSSNDMAKYALKRPSDEDSSTSPESSSSTAGQSTQQATVRPAAESSPVTSPVAGAGHSNSGSGPASAAVADSGRADQATATSAAATSTTQSAVAVPAANPGDVNPASISAELGGQFSDPRSAPSMAWSQEQRIQKSAENLRTIAEAITKYRAAEGSYPPPAIYGKADQPLLSWRVAILPYLGYEKLYEQFQHDQPWDSPHNLKLLQWIPSVYQSPDRWDSATNYQVPVGATTLFQGPRGVHPRRIDDGVENTLMLLEVDDAVAVPWTEPRDWEFDAGAPDRHLGQLRGGSFLGVWGSGSVRAVDVGSGSRLLKGAMTIDGGEAVAAAQISQAVSRYLDTLVSSGPAGSQSTSGSATSTDNPAASSSGDTLRASDNASRNPAVRSRYWMQQIQNQRAAGNDSGAAAAYYAWLLLQPQHGRWADDFVWVPGLRRPTTMVRCSMGVDYTGPGADQVKLQLARASRQLAETEYLAAEQRDNVLQSTLGPAGLQFVQLWQALPLIRPRPFEVQPQQIRSTAATRRDGIFSPVPLAPNLMLLGVDTPARLIAISEKYHCDLLVRFEIRQQATGGRAGQVQRLKIVCVDIPRRRELYSSATVNTAQLLAARHDVLVDDPLAQLFADMENWMREQLSAQPVPSQLRPQDVQQRVAQLIDQPRGIPLAALAELKYYHSRDLVPLQSLLEAYQQLIGSAGLELLAGDETAREAAIRQWLPEPITEQQLAALTARTDRDDD